MGWRRGRTSQNKALTRQGKRNAGSMKHDEDADHEEQVDKKQSRDAKVPKKARQRAYALQ